MWLTYRLRNLLTVMGLGLACVAGCHPRNQATTRPGLGSSLPVQKSQPRPGGKGNPVRTVVSISPAVTEMIFALGQGTRLVGVSEFCNYPPEAKRIPRCGGFIDPNLEVLSQLRPDLVVVQGLNEKTRDWCRKSGCRSLVLKLDRLEDVYHAIRALGESLDCSEAADRLVGSIKKDLDSLSAKVRGRRRVPVFLCLGREEGKLEGLLTTGKGTFLEDLVEICGGANVFSDAGTAYPQPSLESLVKRAPEVIVELGNERSSESAPPAKVLREWQALPSLPAVKNRRVVIVSDDYALIPGPRVTKLARRIAETLHPEVFVHE